MEVKQLLKGKKVNYDGLRDIEKYGALIVKNDTRYYTHTNKFNYYELNDLMGIENEGIRK